MSDLTTIYRGYSLLTSKRTFMKNSIKKKEINKKGIYVIKNLTTGKIYIGSSVNVSARYRAHRSSLRRNVHNNKYLQRSYNKYGSDNFEFYVLEVCGEEDNVLDIEQGYLDNQHPEYNISTDAIAPMTNRKHSKETIEFFKENNKGEKNGMFGKKHSKRTLEIMSINRKKSKMSDEMRKEWIRNLSENSPKPFLGKKHTEETKKKLSNAAKKTKIECCNGKKYNSQIEAARDLNIKQGHISEAINGKRKTAGGYKFWKV